MLLATEDDLSGVAGWVVDVVDRLGPIGVGALIALENLFPPIPSEVILPFAGFSASRGDLNLMVAWLAATLGSLVGAWILYGVGRAIGYERIHQLAGKRWFFLFGQSDLERGERFFDRQGDKVVLLCRFVPLVRSIVSVPAGMDEMPLGRFTVLTAIGSAIWNLAFLLLGNALGDRWDQVEGWVTPIGYAVLVVLVVVVAWLTLRRMRAVRTRNAV